MSLVIKKAEKKQAKLKACLVGPAGAGKTYTALTFARELAGETGTILVLDSEKGSASLYSDEFAFDVIELWARDENRRPVPDPFHPDKYIEAIHLAEEGGYAVLVIDSLSHVWNDEGGFLDLVNRTAQRKARAGSAPNTYTAWADIDPLYRTFLNTLTDARVHLICTMRSKTDTALEIENGKSVVKKHGTKAIQRENLEYEFTLYCQMELDNTLVVEKTRCSAINGRVVKCPTGDFLTPVIAWLGAGAPDERPAPSQQPAPVSPARLNGLYARGKKLGLYTSPADFEGMVKQALGWQEAAFEVKEITEEQAAQVDDYLYRLDLERAATQQSAARKQNAA